MGKTENIHKNSYKIVPQNLKKYSTMPIIREMYRKTTLKWHFSPIQLAKLKMQNTILYWRGVGNKSVLYAAGENTNCYNPHGKKIWQFLTTYTFTFWHNSVTSRNLPQRHTSNNMKIHTAGSYFVWNTVCSCKIWKIIYRLLHRWVNKLIDRCNVIFYLFIFCKGLNNKNLLSNSSVV